MKKGNGHQVLFAGGKFAYVHVTSKGKNVACTGSCLKVWPNVTSSAKPHASGGVKAGHLTRNAHHDVSYFGLRLYSFSYDLLGKALGDHINSFGGSWRLVNASGKLA